MGDVVRTAHGLPFLSDGESITADIVRNPAAQSLTTFKDPEKVLKAYKETLDVENKGPLAVFHLVDIDLRNAMQTASAMIAVGIASHGQPSSTIAQDAADSCT